MCAPPTDIRFREIAAPLTLAYRTPRLPAPAPIYKPTSPRRRRTRAQPNFVLTEFSEVRRDEERGATTDEKRAGCTSPGPRRRLRNDVPYEFLTLILRSHELSTVGGARLRVSRHHPLACER